MKKIALLVACFSVGVLISAEKKLSLRERMKPLRLSLPHGVARLNAEIEFQEQRAIRKVSLMSRNGRITELSDYDSDKSYGSNFVIEDLDSGEESYSPGYESEGLIVHPRSIKPKKRLIYDDDEDDFIDGGLAMSCCCPIPFLGCIAFMLSPVSESKVKSKKD